MNQILPDRQKDIGENFTERAKGKEREKEREKGREKGRERQWGSWKEEREIEGQCKK